jgi:hypothetical protein
MISTLVAAVAFKESTACDSFMPHHFSGEFEWKQANGSGLDDFVQPKQSSGSGPPKLSLEPDLPFPSGPYNIAPRQDASVTFLTEDYVEVRGSSATGRMRYFSTDLLGRRFRSSSRKSRAF